ncbi:mannose-1-phosphate guanylyltransferase/mannose-6-phosphate isomerase [Aestuariivirga sp.]|uniref:mannose-1-phosphate guanylyltransferase/mannose-6-phosphate isomerase n=1 Tax=Aestuariivirga sp. TaxID=2650926 RepID=UPI0025BA8E9A|nr:mannose-1-phosphate guanylyltransferase/mannose-6-phosphate isomerase [Aestuariivirga sp.]MCA3555042.1 mannose-1-phosphate guanylyltransferase/mannose-6-phosphate isomerase [Aestuariivirga sp.]
MVTGQAGGIIHPVILCGGSGTRLWPVSRQSFPKQFSRLVGEESLFQATARRLSGEGYASPVVVTSADFRFVVRDQLAAIGIAPAAVLIEPSPRNTAPAVLAATLWLERQAPGALALVAPSDHLMPDPASFRLAVAAGARRAGDGGIVTFGIRPHAPETGYGYLELAAAADGAEAVPLAGFVEKPDLAAAKDMLASGRHLWNAGIFLFRSDTMIGAFARLAPDLLPPVTRAVDEAGPDLAFLRLAPGAWDTVPSISIDYAIMERAGDLWAVPYGGGWTDLGGWAAVWSEGDASGDGVVQEGAVLAIGCRDSLLRSEDETLQLVGIGLDGIVAVAMPDAVLVARKADAQRVKDAVEAMKENKVAQATAFRSDRRPWGWFETLATGERFKVKRIVVLPGAALSLQSHRLRSEHWIVVEGTARVTVGGSVRLVSENQSVYIPLGEKHRLENPGQSNMVLIEVQTGSYFGEDDIIRYEDIYARN